MHFIGFVMIEPQADIELATAGTMAPFDQHREVTQYRVHLDHPGLLRMASHYGIAPANLHALAEKMEDWTFYKGGVDADGLYYVTNCNPDGYFDWYEIGGRWNGWLNGENVITAGNLASDKKLKKRLPYFILTPDGDWIKREYSYLVGNLIKTETMSDVAWLKKVRRLLERWPDHQVVCVDAHC